MSDVLIVGAGSAGCIVAERLSCDSGCRVTVLESGPGPGDASAFGLTADAATLPIGPDSPVARHYRTLLTGHPPRQASIVRGDCVGGSGAINGGYFRPPAPEDIESLPGWSWHEAEEHLAAVLARIPVRRAADFAYSTTQFIAAARDCGYGWLPDLETSRRVAGVGPVPLNVAGGQRVGPGAAFLIPALGRPNLSLLTGTRVIRVRVAGGRAVGVDAVGPAGPVRIAADRVVLCAGAVASAQLLMLSGLGPAGSLSALGIAVLADLPVGQRCFDHPEHVIDTGWPAAPGHPVLEAAMVVDGLEIRPYTRGFGTGATQIGVALMAPQAHGRVSLISADPSSPPHIEHRYDSEPADVEALAQGCRRVADMLDGTTDVGRPQWSTSQHLCGTAPMGFPADEHAVVDPQCRVRGVRDLWVIDGSVLPRIPGRGPHATIAVIAHRAAEFVSAADSGSAGA